MHPLSLVLAPEAVGRLQDVIACLGRFNESVFIEAQKSKVWDEHLARVEQQGADLHQLVFSALNASKSALASFTLDSHKFFSKYRFVLSGPERQGGENSDRFTCQVYNKALLSVFKGRLLDGRDKDTLLERCELGIREGGQKADCRLVIKMLYRHGVIKTCRLTYESVDVVHAVFDAASAPHYWTISAGSLKGFSEHFGPKTEHLDIHPENGRCVFTSYAEKVVGKKDVLKQSLQTSVAVDTLEFETFSVEDMHHIVINVKDFKTIVAHADSLGCSISARYSYPNRPMRISYSNGSITCEFTLMTTGGLQGITAAKPPPVSHRPLGNQTARTEDRQPLMAARSDAANATSQAQRPQTEGHTLASQREQGSSPPPPETNLDDQSLFFPEGTADEGWNARNENNEAEDRVYWDASAETARPYLARDGEGVTARMSPSANEEDTAYLGIAPTQRISEVKGLFDDL